MVDPRVVDGGRDESLGGGPVAGEAEPAEEPEVVAEPVRSGTPVPVMFESVGDGALVSRREGGRLRKFESHRAMEVPCVWTTPGRSPRLLFERAQSLRQARILEEVVEHVHDIVPPPLGQRRQDHRHRRRLKRRESEARLTVVDIHEGFEGNTSARY